MSSEEPQLLDRQEKALRIRNEAVKIADASYLRDNFVYSETITEIVVDSGVNPLRAPEFALAKAREEILSEKFSDFFESQFGLPTDQLFSDETGISRLEEAMANAQSLSARESLRELIAAKKSGLNGRNLRPEFQVASFSRYGDPDDLTDVIFTDVLKSSELRDKWLRTLYDVQKKDSERNLKEIDEAAEKGEVVKKELVIVGGGPITSLAVSIMSPFYDITVITEEESVGEPWLHRPIYLNSPAEQSTLDEPRFPLQDATSTSPVTPSGFINVPDLGQLVNEDSLQKVCDAPGVVRRYPKGPDLGAVVATNIAYYTKDYLVGQKVDKAETEINPDGSVSLEIVDKQGTRRIISAEKVLFLTGPGTETLKFGSEIAKSDFEAGEKELDELISTVKEAVARGGKPPDVANLIPRILTLPRIQKLSRLWDVDLGRDPENYPFKNLLDGRSTLLYAGKKDTSLTLQELFSRRPEGDGEYKFGGPPEFYPETTEGLESPNKIVVGEGEFSTRRRYSTSVEEGTTIVDGRVEDFFISNRGKKVTTVVAESTGRTAFLTPDYLILATGLKKSDPFSEFPLLNLAKQEDINFLPDEAVESGYVVGISSGEREGRGASVLVGGSATGFEKNDFPEPITACIDELGIGANTIALWVHATLAERLIWNDLAKSDQVINKDKFRRLINKTSKSSVVI